MHPRLTHLLTALLLLAWTPQVWALTVIEGQGRAYPIAEASQADQVKKAYNRQKQSAARPSQEELEKKWIVRLEKTPTTAMEERVREVDVTFTLPFDLKDAKGNIIYPEGYTYNPLARISMTRLIVIDGTDEEQIRWAVERREELQPAKILLSKGSLVKVKRQYGIRTFHLNDQIMERMQIEQVPCTVVQNDGLLEVTEYRADRLYNE
jgi:conjugal transfer pilus assembly protein TraW